MGWRLLLRLPAASVYRLLVSGALTVDTGWGWTLRLLGPFGIDSPASRKVVSDVIAAPYLGRVCHRR